MRKKILLSIGLLSFVAAGWGGDPTPASALTRAQVDTLVRQTGVPDYNATPNWANSPILRKFVDDLPGLCTSTGDPKNALGQCITVAVPITNVYGDADYYEIELVQYREQMHSDLPPLTGDKTDPNTTGGTLLRGYRQSNAPPGSAALIPQQLGPVIIAQKDRPVRIKFTNKLPTGDAGKLFIPVDTTVMGSGPGPNHDRTGDPRTDAEVCEASPNLCFSQNRADLHLHGGRSPWISDGTAHQWITPATETTAYPKGASVAYVPDMWFDGSGNTIASCAGKTTCTVAGATNNPGPGSQTYYYTNGQSARMMFYHDHSWGITRLNVYAGEVAGYFVTDGKEAQLQQQGLLPDAAHTIPLIIQDKTFVDASTILATDPTWIWGSDPADPGSGLYGVDWSTGANPVTGDLWWPHVYVPAQNPYNPDFSGVNPFGRWHYGPWFWPPVTAGNGPIPNPYYDPASPDLDIANQPPEIPSTPNPSWGAEAFMDTPVVNGTAYPKLNVQPTKYRFRILNGAHDRFWNLQLYVADPASSTAPVDCPTCEVNTEVAMIPAYPSPQIDLNVVPNWPIDNREGGVPDPAYRGPAMIQVATEGGFLPKPALLPNQPINWNVDPTTFTAGLVLQQNQGGGTLMLGPAERADIVVDFSKFAGKTLILYNDAPAPWPALDPHYDYYTGAPDNRDMGGANTTLAGRGPNTRTIMQIVVGAGADNSAPPDDYDAAYLDNLKAAFAGATGVFATGQEPIMVGQSAYNTTYGTTFPNTWPNWGVSRITDTSISFMQPNGAIISNYPMEPKAIQDEMGEVFDEFGRMSAKLGLEMAFTTANIQTFILQNFVDPPTEIVAKDQVQIWKITHNGVDTHPVHFHLFEVQVLNRVGWDGFIYLPDDNELGWKDTLRISPLEDTIVALRPAKVPTPFTVPNSIRPLNPAYPLGVPAGFTNLDPKTGQALTTPVLNEMFNFGHEYLWHCHILSHEEQDMMRPIVLNANQLLYTDNNAQGFWQWNRGDWSQISTANPTNVLSSGTYAYATTSNGLWQWNGYNWRRMSSLSPVKMVAKGAELYVEFAGAGIYHWNGASWTRISSLSPANMAVSEFGLFATLNNALYSYANGGWTRIHTKSPAAIEVSDNALYANFAGSGIYKWDGSTWTRLHSKDPGKMLSSGTNLYVTFTGAGLYRWDGTAWLRLSAQIPASMDASINVVYANFPGGLYQFSNTSWTRISGMNPTTMDASGSILYANFAGIGVRKWEFNAWSTLTGAPSIPTTIAAGF